MTWTEAQKEVLDNITTGFHMNFGEPCECGSDAYSTRTKTGYSDFMTFKHKCQECGNEFSTYIEG